MKIEEILKADESLTLIHKENDLDIETISNTDEQAEGSIYFVSGKKFWEFYRNLSSSFPANIVIDIKFFDGLEDEDLLFLNNKKINLLTSKKAPLSICKISKIFYDQKLAQLNYQVDGRKVGTTIIHPSSRIAENTFIGENVEIGEDCVIMSNVSILPNSKIGNNVVIYPNCTIYANTHIGDDCRIHANTAIGSDGFGYNHDGGIHHKIWHFGGVRIGKNVEMGSGCTIDQGTFSPTRIEDGSKLDNQVHIAHNVHVGKGVILCGQVGLAGSAKAGDYCVFGGKSGLSDGVEIGKGCQVGGTSIATTNWEDGSVIGGFPARPLKEWLRGLAYVRKNSTK